MSKIPVEVNELIQSINRVSRIISQDLDKIAEQGSSARDLKILSSDSDNKVIDKIMMIIKSGKSLIDLSKSASEFEEDKEDKEKKVRNFESSIS